jgi:hypothetical protein
VNEPVKFEPFFTETDYPKFVALFPDELPSTYNEFVTRIDKRLEQRMEQLSVEKATVGYVEFIAECERRGEIPNYELIYKLAFLVWGRNNGFHASHS